MTEFGDHAVTTRGGLVENRHAVHAAIVDDRGRLLFSLGDPRRVTLARSSAKPVQALAVLETGGPERCGFDEADLALMCASHSSEDRHVDRARSMLAKVGADESDLRCGGHTPLSEAVNQVWIREGFSPTPLCSNCSGKHVGMLAGARALGAAVAGYHLADHPMQREVKRVMAELCDLPPDGVEWAIDGCNLPTPAFPLDRLALVYGRIAAAADEAEAQTEAGPRVGALAAIFRAMTRHPGLVAGEDRFCTVLMGAHGGALVGKIGADGCYGLGIRACETTRRLGASGAIGVAAKVEDGSTDILCAVVAEILAQLEVGTAEMRRAYARFHRPPRVNTMGVETGSVSTPFRLRAA